MHYVCEIMKLTESLKVVNFSASIALQGAGVVQIVTIIVAVPLNRNAVAVVAV